MKIKVSDLYQNCNDEWEVKEPSLEQQGFYHVGRVKFTQGMKKEWDELKTKNLVRPVSAINHIYQNSDKYPELYSFLGQLGEYNGQREMQFIVSWSFGELIDVVKLEKSYAK